MRNALRLLCAYGLLLLLVLAAGPPTRALVVAALLLCAGLHAVSLWQTQPAAPPRPVPLPAVPDLPDTLAPFSPSPSTTTVPVRRLTAAPPHRWRARSTSPAASPPPAASACAAVRSSTPPLLPGTHAPWTSLADLEDAPTIPSLVPRGSP